MTARGLDHLVIAVRDLEAAAEFYRRLGFQVGARNRHPWGTENRLVQFPGCFLELITVDEGVDVPPHEQRTFSFGAFVKDYLARREGLAMVVLESRDADADRRSFAADGIGDFEPFEFERRGRRPDGSEVHVAFSLAFARDPDAPELGFFVCQQRYPENFWNPEFQRHPNGAQNIGAVVVAAPEPARHRGFLQAFTGAAASKPDGDDLSLDLGRGRIDVLTSDDAAEIYGSVEVDPDRPTFAAFAVRVPDLRAVAGLCERGQIPFQTIGQRLVVPASVAAGVAIAFEQA